MMIGLADRQTIDERAPETAAFFTSYFTAKSRHDPAKTMAHFSPDLITYTDATLGWDLGSFDGVKKIFDLYMPKWPPSGKSYRPNCKACSMAVRKGPEG